MESIKDLIAGILKQSGTEGMEEMLTEVSNMIFDGIIMQDQSNIQMQVQQLMQQGMTRKQAEQQVLINQVKQVALAGVGGALSGGFLGGVTNVASYAANAPATGIDTGKKPVNIEGLLDDVYAQQETKQAQKNTASDETENTLLSDADLDEYIRIGKTQHTRNKKIRMVEQGNSPILTSMKQVKGYILDAIHGRVQGETKAYGRVGSRLANDVNRENPAVDISGYYLELTTDDLAHAYKEHSAAKEDGDIPLTEEDFMKIPEYVNDYDYILSVENYNGKKKIRMAKKINGYTVILETISSERKSIHVQNMIGMSTKKFLRKYKIKINAAGSPGGQKPQTVNTTSWPTVHGVSGAMAPITTVPQLEQTVNRNDSPNIAAELHNTVLDQAQEKQAYKADLSKYDAKQQKTIQMAMASGFLNNTKQTHDFVDFIAKISADKGVAFDFTNNQRLRESGFAIDGVSVNGYVTKDGITLNVDSEKALNRVVGHEITHILEGTQLYAALENAVVQYAKTKAEYHQRLAALTELYSKADNADVNAELVADLVGDYLFTDADFIRNLSVQHRNVFQKIFDEIKYLYRVATAGSQEARQLEKVKKAFEDAYRSDSKAQTETKYSLTIKHTDGTVEELVDVRDLTNEQAVNYLNQAKSGKIKWDAYIPVRKDTPQVIIDTLAEVGENVKNLSLVMQVRKAQQAMSAENRGNRSGKHGSNIRKHALSPDEVVEIVNKLDDPNMVILQTNRQTPDGEPLPNNVAVFVEYTNSDNEGFAVIEFESSINPEYIGTEYGDTDYHTVVTVFEPDVERDGMPYDYAAELLSNPDNIELEIKRRQHAESAIGKKHPNTSSELPSSSSRVTQNKQPVKASLSDFDGKQLSKEQQEFFKYNKNNEDPAHFISRLKSLKKALPTNDHAGSSTKSNMPQDKEYVKNSLTNTAKKSTPTGNFNIYGRDIALSDGMEQAESNSLPKGTGAMEIREIILEGCFFDLLGV